MRIWVCLLQMDKLRFPVPLPHVNRPLRDFAIFGEESCSISRGLFTFENILYLSRKTPQKYSNSAVCLSPSSSAAYLRNLAVYSET